ncbi:hypothetical protein JCM10207_007659 [Rhodosporidiobolus poonsookiae]
MPPKRDDREVEIEASYRVKVVKDLRLDITDELLSIDFPLSGMPLKGAWTFKVKRIKDDLVLALVHGSLRTELLGQRVKISHELCWIDAAGEDHALSEDDLKGTLPMTSEKTGKPLPGAAFVVSEWQWEEAAAGSNGKYEPVLHRDYRLSFTLEANFEDTQLQAHGQTKESAKWISPLHLRQTPHNVRLFFPHAHESGAELWSTSDALSRSSPHFKTLLESGFAETVPKRSKRKRGGSTTAEATPAPEEGDKDFADSDDETDAFLFSTIAPQLSASEGDDAAYQQVTITQAAFSTYHAVLVYLGSGFINFAPLSSSFPSPASSSSDADESSDTRLAHLQSHLTAHPTLPLPVSPKSVYRLAHLLQLPSLSRAALAAFRSSLTPSTAPQELFTDCAIAYEELRRVVVEFVVERWGEVEGTESWREVSARVEADEVEGAAPVLLQLLGALSSRKAAAA